MEKSLAVIAAACEVWLRQQEDKGLVVRQDVEQKKAAFLAELTKVVTP